MHNLIKLVSLLLVMTPMLAHSYSLTTRINTIPGGQLQVNAFPVQTTASVLRTIPNGTNVNIVITPGAGYVILRVQQGATNLPVTPGGQTVNIPSTNIASQTINVWFDKTLISVTATAGPGGTVSPPTQNVQQGTSASCVFTPNAGNKVISISGTPAGATCNGGACSGPWATNTPVTVAFTVPATAVTMNGVFLSVIANAGVLQTVLTGSTVTLDGSASTGAVNYTWTQTAGPPVTLSSSTVAKPTFVAAVVGTYRFMLVVDDGAGGSGTAYTNVFVTNSAAEAARVQCQNCHEPIGVGVANQVFLRWSSSKHEAKVVMCTRCHVGSDSGAHPTLVSGSVDGKTFNYTSNGTNFCITCHDPKILTDFAASRHFVVAGSASCSFCHMPSVHNPSAACMDCHYSGNSLGLPWPPTGLEFHSGFSSSNVCTMCHTKHNPKVLTFEGCK